MFRPVLCSFILLVILLSCELAAQGTYTYGNLLRINFDQTEVSLQDTTGKWFNIREQQTYGVKTEFLKYYKHFTMQEKEYFLTKLYASDDRPFFGYSGGIRLLESVNYPKGREFGITINAYWDVPSPFMIDRTRVVETKNGNWLISGDFHNAFLGNNDSLLTVKSSGQNNPFWYGLKSIIGKAGSKYLWTFYKNNGYEYYLSDLNDSPDLDTSRAVKVIFTNNNLSDFNVITEVKNIRDDLYAVAKFMSRGIDIYRLAGNNFYYIKNTMHNDFFFSYYQPLWECKNSTLYLAKDFNLNKYSFNSADSTFGSPTVLLDSLSLMDFDMTGNYGIDNAFRYLARIYHSYSVDVPDTLKVYDIDKAAFITRIILKGVKGALAPIVDPPYVYIHQVTREYTQTGVQETISGAPKSFRLTVFPNPFNPSTSISYSLKKQASVELKIFDMLGRELATLVNDTESAGEHKVLFNAASLPSGMYICTMKAGSQKESRKLLLLK